MFPKKITLFGFCLSLALSTIAQVKLSQWREHYNYANSIKVIDGGNQVYCFNSSALFAFEQEYNSMKTITKLSGLNDFGFKDIEYSKQLNTLVIAYETGNIDLIKKGKVENVPQLKNKQNLPDKTINSIYLKDNLAYFSCNLGVIVLNIHTNEFVDTWYPSENGLGNPVYSLCIFQSEYIVATETGIFRASLDEQVLANYTHWTKDKNIPNGLIKFDKLVEVGNNLVAFKRDTGNSSLLVSTGGDSWSQINGLSTTRFLSNISVSQGKLYLSGYFGVEVVSDQLQSERYISIPESKYATRVGDADYIANASGMYIHDNNGNKLIKPDGPGGNIGYKISIVPGMVWITGGKVGDGYGTDYNNSGAYRFSNNQWNTVSPYTDPLLIDFRDFIVVAINPNDYENTFISSWFGYGLMEFRGNQLKKIHDPTNSTLDYFGDLGITKTIGAIYDIDGNLWVTNSSSKTPINVLDTKGKWHSFGFENFQNEKYHFGEILITSWGHKWVYLDREHDGYILVFDDNRTLENTEDDRYKVFIVQEQNQAEVSDDVFSLVEDNTGSVWIGTQEGPLIYYDARSIFDSDQATKALRIKVPVSKKSDEATYLLENEAIHGIAVDGANRKWIATAGAGVFYVTEDGSEELLHFTKENSPLPSNTIFDVDVEPVTGEVFFATDRGIVSYRAFATNTGNDFGKVYVFPNPVKHGYVGDIVVTGLANNVNVKITDISGNLVYEGESLGGQAIWNGRNLQGRKVGTGIYLVFASKNDESQTKMAKFMIIK